MRAVGAALLVLQGAFACTATKPPVPPRSRPAPAALQGPRERLARALRSIARPEPVLAALPLVAQERLQARLAGLDEERKLAVHSDDGPLVENLPLLHLISGGTSPRALYALATSSAGSEELAGLGIDAVGPPGVADAARVALVRELARRAALHFLRDRAADVAEGGKGSALVSRLVARAARAVERADLLLLARELLASAEPSPQNTLEVANELARAGDIERAEQRFEQARRAIHGAPPAAALATTQGLIEAARVASSVPAPADASRSLSRARAWLRLGRVSEAARVLAPWASLAESRLDLAAAIAETEVATPSCPDLPLDVGSGTLCAAAFRASPGVKRARDLLERAWQSGAGRDDEAVEVYAALAHVIPWMHEAAADISQGALSTEQSSARIAALLGRVRQIAAVSPPLSGLVLFLETVHSGPAQRVAGRRSDADAAELWARALSLASVDSSRFAEAGVLAVAAALSHQRDVSVLLDAISIEKTTPALRVPRAALKAWVAASTGQAQRMDEARSELAAIMSEGQGESLERARLVLSVSEVDALLGSSERGYQLLSRVAGQLLSDNIPPDLALRSVLDAAGALAHGGRYEQAQKILKGVNSADLPADLERARDLLRLIQGYEWVLKAREPRAATLPEVRAGLAALASQARGEAASVWFELWLHELDAVQRDEECQKKKLKSCPAAEQLRRAARRGLDARLGELANAVLTRGALPGGSFDAGFRFTVERGLEPLLVFDPNFLAVALPRPARE